MSRGPTPRRGGRARGTIHRRAALAAALACAAAAGTATPASADWFTARTPEYLYRGRHMIYQVSSVRLDAHVSGRQQSHNFDTLVSDSTIDARMSIRTGFRPPPRYDDEGDNIGIAYDFRGGPIEGLIRTEYFPVRMEGRIRGWGSQVEKWDGVGRMPKGPLDCAVRSEPGTTARVIGWWTVGSPRLKLHLPALPPVAECGIDLGGGTVETRIAVPRRALRRRVVRIPVRVTSPQPNPEGGSLPPVLVRWAGEIRLRRVMSCPLHANDACEAFHDE